MELEQLRQSLASVERLRPFLPSWNLRDPEYGWRNLTHLAEAIGLERLRDLWSPLGRFLPRCPDADMALNNLERFLAGPKGAAQLPILLEGRSRTLEILLQCLSNSQFFSDLLVANPDFLEMLRIPLRRSPHRAEMRTQLQAEVDACFEDSAILRAFRRFRHRQILRIGANDIIRDRPLEEITRDISTVAEVSLEAALTTAWRQVAKRFGQPHTVAGQPARCVIVGFGKLGGEELNYSSDIDLMVIYDEEGTTRGPRSGGIGNDEFFSRVTTEVVRLLSAHSPSGQAYRVDLRLRPEGNFGPLARSLASTLSYYDTFGRTWERQALIKVRPVAGDLELGQEFLRAIEPFVYRKYLGFTEINGIKVLKRQIEQKVRKAGISDTEVKTGHGGIRDIEFTIQFLQLLNGGDLADLRQRNTLLAMQALERAGCLTALELQILEDAYRFLRKTEHRLQLLFDLQTHRLPTKPEELRNFALRMGYTFEDLDSATDEVESQVDPRGSDSGIHPPQVRSEILDPRPPVVEGRANLHDPQEAFLYDYREKTDRNRKILNHLLHDTFPDEGQAEPESDLLLVPNPDKETIRAALGKYGFRDVEGAYQNLVQLARESVPFLSTRRCRHFLASIAPKLLRALAETPDPDMALVNLEKVTASLGAKAVLWELFSFNEPILRLYVDLCAWSQFLSEILINNPGMIDELLDTLVLNQPRIRDELRMELAELCRGADDYEPILHSFQDKELLRIGVGDILGKVSIQETTAGLSDLAETILSRIATLKEPAVVTRFGVPHLASGPRAGQPSRYVLLGLGKLGSREMSYHSDLDLILVYEGDGRTRPAENAVYRAGVEVTDNFHFYTELAQHIIKATSYLGPMGRLYAVDMRLRPTGQSGSLVVPLAEFRRYYAAAGSAEPGQEAQPWERQALTRARVVHGDIAFGEEVRVAVEEAICAGVWTRAKTEAILAMRERLEANRSGRDLKRGFGGIIDIEFLVQRFQLAYGRQLPTVRRVNTWEALDALRDVGLLTPDEHRILCASYTFLRRVEARLRIVHNRSLDEVPENLADLDKLARRLGYEGADTSDKSSPGKRFRTELDRHTTQTREVFRRTMEQERTPSVS